MPHGHPIFAAYYRLFGGLADRGGFADHRRRLLAEARGGVVEIGAGPGLNFPWEPAGGEGGGAVVETAAGTGLTFPWSPAGVEVVATEPDPHMLRGARKAAGKAAAKLGLREARAEPLPLPSGSAATVVATLVLCSVPVQAAVLAEVGRVLKPG